MILRACAYRAEDRYQSAEEFLDALDHISPEQKAGIIEQDLNVTQRARPALSEKNWQGIERSGFETVPADFGSNFVQNKVENSKTNSRPFLPTPPSRLLIKIVLGLTVLIMLVAGISAIYVLKTSGSKKENNNVLGSSETQDVGATINVLQSASTESNDNMAELPEPPKADYRNGGTIAVGYDVSLGSEKMEP